MGSKRWVVVLVWVLGGCGGELNATNRSDAAVALDATEGLDAPGVDATPDAGCVPGCHWDCFGGSTCVNGTAWVNGYAPRSCCTFSDPWPGPGPVCSLQPVGCPDGVCHLPDPRYAACLRLLGTPSEPCPAGSCEQIRLYCSDGPAQAGDPCTDDRDCRPAAEGAPRLRCGGEGTCVEEARPEAPEGYGANCGLAAGDVFGPDERVVRAPACPLCQVLPTEGCLRQACTIECTYDEDCPSGSVCLCSSFGGAAISYCAEATDRTTPEGRAAGLPACTP